MISQQIKDKGILAKLLEKGIKILLQKECKNIRNLKINISGTSLQIIKGIIQEIYIVAEGINYKDLIFDKIELVANEVKITFKINNNELKFKKNSIIDFKISLSEKSLKEILLSDNWSWIRTMITKEILTQAKLKDIKIKNNQLFIKVFKDKSNINELEKIDILTKNGNLYLKNEVCNKSLQIPIEDKIKIKDLILENNLINILASSSISF